MTFPGIELDPDLNGERKVVLAIAHVFFNAKITNKHSYKRIITAMNLSCFLQDTAATTLESRP